MDTISVIIPVYNSYIYLNECLESLSKQTYTEWEGVLIEDGSTDGKTPALCDEWAKRESRLKVFHYGQNRGVAVARNIALKKASGTLVTFLDSDDSLLPTHLESLYKALKKTNASIAMCGVQRRLKSGKHYKNDQMFPKGAFITQPDIFVLVLIDRKIGSHLWNKLYYKKLFEGIQFIEGYNYEDYRLMLEIVAKADSLVHTGEATYCYRHTPGSITRTQSLKNHRDFFLAALERLKQLKLFPHLSDREKVDLLVWPIKRMISRFRRIRKLPSSKERDTVIKNLESLLIENNISPTRGAVVFQIICYTLQKKCIQKQYPKRIQILKGDDYGSN